MVFNLEDFRTQYDALVKQYSLPSFTLINNDFELEKISQESMTVLRIVRKTMMEKVFSILSFLELLLNPVNAPRTYLSYIKSISNEDRKAIDTLYGLLGDLTLRALPLEINYSEKREADMIKDIYGVWRDAKPPLTDLMNHIATPIEEGTKKERSYYG